MDNQEVFDKVVAHLRAQGRRAGPPGSTGVYSNCMYRFFDQETQTTLKCAAGCLIEDHEYGEWMEGRNILGILSDSKCPDSLIARLDSHPLLKSLQLIHDDSLPETWEEMLKGVAQRYDLQYQAPR